MPIDYFSKFPIITYNDKDCVDISRRVILNDDLRYQVETFYPYDVAQGLRPDHIAGAYYDDEALDWLIHLSTEIIDPYYGWPLDDFEFENFIAVKYGTVEYAKQKIKHWEIDWEEKVITPSYYNSLPDYLRKYFEPTFDAKGGIATYIKRDVIYSVNTNKVLEFDITIHTSNSFSNGEFVDFKYSGEIIGTGEIVTANSSAVIVQNIVGNATANSTYTLTLIGETTSTNASSNTVYTRYQVLSDDEAAYWSPVTYYDWEEGENAKKRTIAVLNRVHVSNAIFEIIEKLAE